MKRILVLTLIYGVFVGPFALSGCGGLTQEPETSKSSSSEEPHFTFIDTELPLAVAVDAPASYTVIGEPDDRQFESFTVEPSSNVVEVVSTNVASPEARSFTLRASETGEYSVELRAKLADGSRLQHRYRLEVREVAGIRLQPEGYELEDGFFRPPSPYLVDSEAHISCKLVDSEGNRLAGSRPGLVEWEPKEALRLERKERGGPWLVFETASEPGEVTLTSTIGSEEAQIELITPPMVEDIALAEYALYEKPSWKLGIEGLWAAHIVPVYNGVTLFDSSIETSLSSRDPETCDVVTDNRTKFERETGKTVLTYMFEDRWPGDGHVIRLRGGDCLLHAEYPAANDGNGAELDVTIPVAE